MSEISERNEILVGKSDARQPELPQAYDYQCEKKADIVIPALTFENAFLATMGSLWEVRLSARNPLKLPGRIVAAQHHCKGNRPALVSRNHRIATTLVLTASATAFQLWSLVHAGRPSRCASARQKRSPSDSP